MIKILGVGDNVLDAYLFQRKYYPGGNSVNVPVLARRYMQDEVSAGYIGIIGNDRQGRHLYNALEIEGLRLDRIRIADGVTACNHVDLDDNGDRHFIGNNGSEVVEEKLSLKLNRQDYEFISEFDVAHTSIHSFIDDLLPSISRRAFLSIDYSDGYTKQNIAKICPLARFAFFSGGNKSIKEVEDLAKFAYEHGAKTVVVTRGFSGSVVLENEKFHFQNAYKAEVIDSLGAGDSYIASFLVEYFNSGKRIEQAADKASRYAAKCCQYYGAFGHPLPMD